MSTYLFTWNPKKWDWSEQPDLIAKLPHQKPTRAWATISKKNIGIGDHFILIKIGSIPKSEKGIIGIGKIISPPFEDKDFLNESSTRTYVNLEFSQLFQKPLISLAILERDYPTQKWTPEGSGILIKEKNIFDEISNKIKNLQASVKKHRLFQKEIYFPIIAKEIDLMLLSEISIHRDAIVLQLLEKHKESLKKIAMDSNKPILFIAQNMVDWFSAELNKKSSIVKEWQDKYFTTKIRVNGRKITNYSLALNSSQDEVIEDNTFKYMEGSIKQVTVNAYERNSQARKKCLQYWKYSCQCCGFNFEKIYGAIGKDYIHVHHKIPLSKIKKEYILDPIKDLIPVCANCHSMRHRKNPPYTIEEMKNMLKMS